MKVSLFFSSLLLALLCNVAVLAQDNEAVSTEDEIKSVGDKACDCAREISTKQPKDSIVSKINECIRSEIMQNQMMAMLGGLDGIVEEAKKESDTTAQKNVTINIYANKNFDEIQEYMLANCGAVKVLLGSSNNESKHSMSSDKKALAFYEEGEHYYSQGKYDMAIVNFTKAVKRDKKFAFAWDNLGMSYRKRENYAEAIKCYEKSLEIDPAGKMPLQNMAVAYSLLENHAKAAETYERYMKLNPGDPEGHYGAGRAYYYAGDYAKGTDNMFKAFNIYKEAQSPYVKDAQQMIIYFYKDMKEKNKLDIFMETAKKNNVTIGE